MKQLKEEDLVDWWLKKYHSTNLDKVLEENPDWKENPSEHTRDFYNKYPVTQEQYDEWKSWAIQHVKDCTKLSSKMIEHLWWQVDLNCAPNIKENE